MRLGPPGPGAEAEAQGLLRVEVEGRAGLPLGVALLVLNEPPPELQGERGVPPLHLSAESETARGKVSPPVLLQRRRDVYRAADGLGAVEDDIEGPGLLTGGH